MSAPARQRAMMTGRAPAATKVDTRPRSLPARTATRSARMLDLQRQAGNRAVRHAMGSARGPGTGSVPSNVAPSGTGIVELALRGVRHPIAEQLDHPDVRFRVPKFADLKAAYTDPTLKIPEAVIKGKVAQLLGRMQREKRLKSNDPIPDIIARIFPAPGKISESEFNKALDAADRSVIYGSVMEAETTVKKVDKPKLKAAMKDAESLIASVQGDSAGLTAVFGANAKTAATRYAAAKKALATSAANLDKRVSTDYNLDDPEVFLGGWATVTHMHLLKGIVQVVDPAATKATLIHEAAHQADGAVVDQGYYATPGFESMTDDEKVDNAAHYEELPRRVLGTSKFASHTFTAGTKVGGGTVTWEDVARRIASERMRHAWDAAVDAVTLLRDVRKAWLRGKRKPFTDNSMMIMEISNAADLTIHHQAAKKARVTSLDMTLIESVARAMNLINRLARAEPIPAGPYTEQGAAEVLVEQGAAKYGQLFGNPAKDKAAIDWFSSHYKAVL